MGQVWFVSRHPGAVDWAREMGIAIDRWVVHLDPAEVTPGDTVIGTLPLPQVVQLQGCGVTYWHLAVDLPAAMRGRELSAEELRRLGAELRRYEVALVGSWPA